MTYPYPLPRDKQGHIIIGPLDDQADEQPQESPAAEPAPAAQEKPAPEARPPSQAPTPFDQLRPDRDRKAGARSGTTWREPFAFLALGLLLGLAWFAWQSNSSTVGESPAASQSSEPLPTAVPTTEVAPVTQLSRAVVAFDTPGGTPVGALDAGRSYQLVEERAGWRLLDVAESGRVWVRSWEMDGKQAPTAAPLPTIAPARSSVAPVAASVAPAVTCLPVVDADRGNAYLGEACGATSEERQQRALELLQQAPAP